MPVDFAWMSSGSLLLDGSGDIACTPADDVLDIKGIVYSRLKAALHGWKLYSIGANLEENIGNSIDEELELHIKRQVERSLTDRFLPLGSFDVETLPDGDRIHVMVYLGGKLLGQVTLNTSASNVNGV